MFSHTINRFICSQREMWVDLGRLESYFLRKKLDATQITAPVYITGLARGGTTIMLELLAQADRVATHTYRDFPLLFTPYVLRRFYRFTDRFGKGEHKKTERPHKDRILITPSSPESMEEVLWMSFFKKLHEEERDNTLTASTSRPKFEQFYRDHIKKLLLAEGASRYVSKANYNITRLPYLHKLFADAKFLLVIREPAAHIASIAKQHRIFCEAHEKDRTTLEHMNLSGHFEFGLGRKLINVGNQEVMQQIKSAFSTGNDYEAWALYWNSIYAYALTQLETPQLRDHIFVVHYDELCARPEAMLRRVLAFCGLTCAEEKIASMAAGISEPAYYQPNIPEAALARIEAITGETYHAFDRYRLGL